MIRFQSQHKLLPRPSIIYVSDSLGDSAHLRGGDNEIYPLSDISNPRLLALIMDVLTTKTSVSYSELSDLCIDEDYDNELDGILQALIDSRLLFLTSREGELTDLQNILIREGVYNDDVFQALSEKVIVVDSSIGKCGENIAELFSRYGLNVKSMELGNEKKPDLIIAFGSFVCDSFFVRVNQIALETNTPWMMIRQAGFDLAQIGPLFVPGETGCVNCLKKRMASQRDNLSHYHKFSNSQYDIPKGIWSDKDMAFVLDKCLLEIIRYFLVVLENIPINTLVGKSKFIELRDLSSETESLLRLPSCTVCGSS